MSDVNTNDPTGEPPATTTDGTPPPASTPKFTQEDLNRVASREKKDGREAAMREVAEKLGISDLDAVAQILKDHQERQESEKSEAQKAREAADKERAEAEQAKAEAARERHEVRVERYLLRAGVPEGEGDEAGKALAKVAKMLDVETGADADVIQEAVEELKKEFPALFTKSSSQSSDKGGNPDSDTGNKPKKPPAGSASDRARERLAARHPHIVKTD